MERGKDFSERFEEANLLLKYKAFEEACKAYEELISENFEVPELYNNYGLALFYSDRFDEAVEQFRKAIELKSDFSLPYSNIGLVHLNRGEYDRAIDYFKRAIELDPQNPETHYNIAVSYFRIERKSEAAYHFEEFLKYSADEYRNLREGVKRIVSEIRETQKSLSSSQE